MNRHIILLITLCILCNVNVFTQSDTESETALEKTATEPQPAKGALKLDWPLFDLPYQIDAMNTVGHGFFSSYANPGMMQSLAVTQNMYSGFHFGMKYFYDHSGLGQKFKNFIYYGGIGLGHVLFFWMPGATTWLHEEYHRAVMTRFGANSLNPTYRFPIGSTVMPLGLDINDLVRIHNESPPDFVRVYEAGIEGQYVLIDRLQRDNFFYDQQLFHEIGYWVNTVNSHGYVLAKKGDFLGWVTGLFQADEVYEYESAENEEEFTADDLTGDELKYLKLQGGLQVLNYLSPMMFGIRTIPLGDTGYEMNFAMRHYLTSFGADIAAQAYLKMRPFNMVFTLHNYMNYQNYFPAVEAELVDYPLTIGKLEFYLSPRVLIGMQPRGQVFKTASPEFLGLFGLRVDFMAHKNIYPYIDFTAKTNGWVAGNEYLEASASVRLGVSLRF